MRERQSSTDNPKKIFLWILLGIVIATGIFFRLYNLDKKEFWYDETTSAEHVSGTVNRWRSLISDGRIAEAGELLAFQQPNKEHELKDTTDSLIKMEPQHTPLFFCLLYFWAKFVGYSIFCLRILPALISLLQIPAMYWLCIELCGTRFFALLGMSLIAVSPIQVLYAQEAREYSLLSLVTLVISASLLRALRKQNLTAWAIYFLSLTAALYSSLMTGLVMAGQFIYVILQKGFKWKGFKYFLCAWLAALLAFGPWLIVLGDHLDLAAGGLIWLRQVTSLPRLFQWWGLNFASPFFDPGYYYMPMVKLAMPLVLLIELYAAIVVSRKSARVARFLFTLIGTSTLPFMITDLVFGGQRSNPTRYEMAAMNGLIVLVAYLFYIKLRSESVKQQLIWGSALSLLFLGAVVSCVISSQATTWRVKTMGGNLTAIAKVLNEQSETPLLVTDEDAYRKPRQMLVLSHMLKPSVKLSVLSEPTIPRLAPGVTHFYAYDWSPRFNQYFESTGRCKLTQIDDLADLQRVDIK